LEENASWWETALAGTHDCSDSGRRNRGIDGLVSVPRRGERGGSNPLSTSIAGEDELNDDGFRPLAATHLAHHRNESGIRRSRFVLRLLAAFCGDRIPRFWPTVEGSGNLITNKRIRRPDLPSCRLLAAKHHTSRRCFRDQSVLFVG